MFAQRVVDAVCKTKENISARLSLRAPICVRIACSKAQLCSPQKALSKYSPKQISKKRKNFNNKLPLLPPFAPHVPPPKKKKLKKSI